jgi:hypothetical protein
VADRRKWLCETAIGYGTFIDVAVSIVGPPDEESFTMMRTRVVPGCGVFDALSGLQLVQA